MKKPILIVLVCVACQGNGQPNLASLSASQWQQDLDYLTGKINKAFAGFTPELKTRFASEASKLRAAIPNLSVNQRILEMARLLAMLNDGHTEISIVGPATGFHRVPLILYYFGSDLRVVAVGPDHKSLLGKKITKIEGQPVGIVFEKLTPFMNADNDREYITTAPTLMIIPEVLQVIGVSQDQSRVSITVEDDGDTETKMMLTSITREEYNKTQFSRLYNKTPLYLENPSEGYWFKYLSETRTMYLNIITLFNQDGKSSVKKVVADMLSQLDKERATKLVVDFRLCRGGNYNNILPLIEEVKKRPSLNTKGNLFVVNGRLTFSAASVATIYFKDETQAIVVGEVSRARPNWADNMESYSLPNSELEFDCTERMKVHSPALGNSKTIPVDVEIPRSYEHYKEGRDEVMEYILSLKK